MSFKDRLYKRTTPTKHRKQEQEALIASNLVGLKLSDALDVEAAHDANLTYVEKDKSEIIPKKRQVSVSVRRITDEELAKELKQVPQSFSVQDDNSKDQIYRQNYAIFTPDNPLGNKIMIHGRELFSEAAATKYFSSSDKTAFPYAEFGEAAKEKIRAMLKPKSFADRRGGYVIPTDMLSCFKQYLADLSKEFPGFTLPADMPELTMENIISVMPSIVRAIEAHGIEPEELAQRYRYPSPDRVHELEEKVKIHTLEYLGNVNDRIPPAYQEKLRDYLAYHKYDPEIIHNFLSGLEVVTKLEAVTKKDASLGDIIEAGIEVRTEQILRQLAETIANPYDKKFVEAERIVTDAMVHSVHPRILNNAIKNRAAMLVTDDDTLRRFNEILPAGGEIMLGKYNPKFPAAAPYSSDFVIMSAPNLDYKRLAWIARHEFEHHRDMSSELPFAMVHQTKHESVLQKCLAEDRKHVDEVLGFLGNFDGQASGDDKKRLERLAKARGLSVKEIHSEEGMKVIKDHLLRDIRKVQSFANMTFLPPEGGKTCEEYNMKYAQRLEIPAVIEQFRGEYGRDFVTELFPALHKIYMKHRLQHPGLRNISEQSATSSR